MRKRQRRRSGWALKVELLLSGGPVYGETRRDRCVDMLSVEGENGVMLCVRRRCGSAAVKVALVVSISDLLSSEASGEHDGCFERESDVDPIVVARWISPWCTNSRDGFGLLASTLKEKKAAENSSA